jgi:cytochrome c biogenesis protein CcmG/thiol:disulfide interchange protein DsbE
LNDLFATYKDKLAIIGLSNESLDDVKAMTSPEMDFSVGVDPQSRTLRALELQAIPYALLIDPKGTVRFEGLPNYLDEKSLGRLLAKYSDN